MWKAAISDEYSLGGGRGPSPPKPVTSSNTLSPAYGLGMKKTMGCKAAKAEARAAKRNNSAVAVTQQEDVRVVAFKEGVSSLKSEMSQLRASNDNAFAFEMLMTLGMTDDARTYATQFARNLQQQQQQQLVVA
jgi:hypothetical protein